MSAEYDWILSERYVVGIISLIYDRREIHSRDLKLAGYNYRGVKNGI
ncbi:MAG: hypothetical protein IKD00_06505 [Candidatus Methanomethylophilaceae archaeon]|nr:hypothetical protein [Candidatus Methanomethylophilaceae archaeon]